MYEQSDEELRRLRISTLPRTLLEAAEALDSDSLADEVLGPELKASFVELKTREWWQYHNTVSSWELNRYLDFF
jgi:glutamine synthetase